MTFARQLTLELEGQVTLTKESFFLSPSNQKAYAFLMQWPLWPKNRAVFLQGEKGSGKTHLTHVWAKEAESFFLDINALHQLDLVPFIQKNPHLVLENVEKLADQQVLFHLLNVVKEQEGALLLTSDMSPALLPFELPDLSSRLKSMPLISLENPDDTLIEAILYKRFADLQMKPAKDVVPYILKYCERSFSALHKLIFLLDRASLTHHRRLTTVLVRDCL